VFGAEGKEVMREVLKRMTKLMKFVIWFFSFLETGDRQGAVQRVHTNVTNGLIRTHTICSQPCALFAMIVPSEVA
jgi:hypothetical protein